MTYDLPNPFMFAAPVFTSSLPSGESDPPVMTDWAGAASGYPCCPDCGVREPCDEHCPSSREIPRIKPSRFELDPAAFLSEIEPVPAFISRPIVDEIEALLELARAEDWPAPPVLRQANG